MSYISTALRRLVVSRAGNRCEYCQLSQEGQAATFHVDHIVPVSADGQTTADNLALACVACSLYKAARQHALDPETDAEVSLYHPRQNNWHTHFGWEGEVIVGKTAVGRATVAILKMNRPVMLAIRQEEALIGRHPPVDKRQSNR